MKKLCLLGLLCSLNIYADFPCEKLLKSLQDSSDMPFIQHIVEEDPTSFGNSLALNTRYWPIKCLRKAIEKKIGKNLNFFTDWDPAGEAHVTTITPPEYAFTLNKRLTMKRIHEIAEENKIQGADLKILGIGSAKREIEGKDEETFFIIVDSIKLREIRYKIYEEFVSAGGDPKAFDPTWFFPHITIGYTKKDLHENLGVIKNLKHSHDSRFGLLNLKKVNSL